MERKAQSPTAPQDPPRPFDYAAQWLDEPEAVELALPSGRKVLVRKPDLLDFIRMEGSRIPDPLAPMLYRYLAGREAAGERTPEADLSPGEKLQRLAEDTRRLDVVVAAAVVEPRLALGEPGPGEVAIARLSREDRMCVWRWTEGIATPLLAGFPEQPDGEGGTVPPVGDGAGLPPEAERAAGPDEAGG